jgi:hypothetical protein
MINLYEIGVLKKFNFINPQTLEYEIDIDYQNLNLTEDQILFLGLLKDHVGYKNILHDETLLTPFSIIDNH